MIYQMTPTLAIPYRMRIFFFFFIPHRFQQKQDFRLNFLRIISSSNTVSQKMNVDAVMSMKAEGYF